MYVFTRDASTLRWSQSQRLRSNFIVAGNQYGTIVALNEYFLCASSPYATYAGIEAAVRPHVSVWLRRFFVVVWSLPCLCLLSASVRGLFCVICGPLCPDPNVGSADLLSVIGNEP